MVYKQFRLQVSLRVFLIVLSAIILGFFIQKELFATSVFVFGLIWYQVWLLIQKLNSIAFDMKKFLDSINYDDLTQTFTVNGSGEIQDELNISLQKTLDRFREIRTERESDLMFYKSIAQHVDTGVLAFNTKGKVIFSNMVTKRLFSGIKSSHLEDFKVISEELYDIFKSEEEKETYYCTIPGVYATERVIVQKIILYVKGEVIKVFSIMRVQEEVEKVEIQAWESLITVLTHEIMNAMAPVSSLSDTVKSELEYLKSNYEEKGDAPTLEEITDLIEPMQTITQRTNSMSALVEDFRVMAHLRDSQLQHINVSELCKEIYDQQVLVCEQKGISLKFQVQQDGLLVTADPHQIKVVIENILKNAVEELEGKEGAEIIIRCTQDDIKNKPIIRIIDNGSGIDTDAQQRIFVPFFTTKKGHTGIGLSLARQIMRRNHGRLTLKTSIDAGSEFTLRF
ncbi:sensor histidine kinase [Flammeovirga agarivorans]|uniref:histidine kinase n=1 Tax=Flammeovirga agarivorans TaxID=2726742 RepID=A0A7X8SPN8_9BACT|nr:ATP-binding protein [Flammeovirga agarivorans]NLR93982.1 GHKL domain-containing protein [Flammeovirga agarivorans]